MAKGRCWLAILNLTNAAFRRSTMATSNSDRQRLAQSTRVENARVIARRITVGIGAAAAFKPIVNTQDF
jgi:hypothetical protein